MINKILLRLKKKPVNADDKISSYIKNGRIPWSEGYHEYKEKFIKDNISSEKAQLLFDNRNLKDFGLGIDERCVEYPWIFSKMSEEKEVVLDAGSTFNFNYILNNAKLKNKDLTIFTFYPEKDCFFKKRISYVYGDLRSMYFNANSFDLVVSQSTIEHIDMDNSIYGYGEAPVRNEKSYEYLFAVSEMQRVLKPGGRLLITFPFGKFENHGFFQQFDVEMLDRLINVLNDKGTVKTDFMKYEKAGWRFAGKDELKDVQSFNPHTGKGKSDDGAAHCRSIACIEFKKH